MRVNEACSIEVSMPIRRIRGPSLVSLGRLSALNRSIQRRNILPTTPQGVHPQSPEFLHVASQFAHLSAVVLRPRSSRLRCLGADRESALAPEGQVNGVPSHTVENYGLWCVYDGEMYLRSRRMLMLRPAACSSYARVPAVAVTSVLITASLSNVISAFFGCRGAYPRASVIAEIQMFSSQWFVQDTNLHQRASQR
ncbi:hypothetical protein BU25DRAFT_236298 [Macroventuria anomochaeta]|uniref:Uncharacterized protein n=1 Tax=Macroventuria anomochaeta TaxID=301207 RepID=A0ACB6RHX9_9PLEO|nr:uncharacterized protein BU25DRAFT_236298 [Macroventuria anomochaeta]KAF2621491.1 hypothetical protein BU25DRAFT_236298 [Macroventuria anomochaeta]